MLSTLGPLYLLKVVALTLRRRPGNAAGLALFLLCWPGVIPDYFRERRAAQAIPPTPFLAAWTRMALGAASVVLLAIYTPRIPDGLLGIAGIAALLLTVHAGLGGLLPWLLRWTGFAVPLLFDRPWAAMSLGEFWSRR